MIPQVKEYMDICEDLSRQLAAKDALCLQQNKRIDDLMTEEGIASSRVDDLETAIGEAVKWLKSMGEYHDISAPMVSMGYLRRALEILEGVKDD